MDAFRYQALDAAGRTVAGVLQADTARQARAQLRAQGLLPSNVEAMGARVGAGRGWVRGLASAELSLLTRQLATLLESGLTMEQSLDALLGQAEQPRTREVLAGIKSEVTSGHSLSAALGAHAASFPEFYRALVQGGEQSGALPTVLQHLADYLDARQALRQKTGLALLYPLLVTGVALAVVLGLMVYVVPQVVQVFEQSRQELPLMTRLLIFSSEFLRAAWPWLLALLAGGLLGLRALLRRAGPRRRWSGWLLRLPWLGPLARGVDTARFAGTLAILVRGGVPLLPALESGARVMGNQVLREAVTRAMERVREGASLARALDETRLFPALLVHMVASGESSGRLGPMLERAAQLETRALERRLAIFLTLLEPLMILLMGSVVMMIVLAILLPIMEINQLVG
ncbi:MAG: type II secretion system inner membrane protein GspF [Rhizobium sp.]|nr:type II secretion system inner membrane protein GspF [Rhizobium sp.]